MLAPRPLTVCGGDDSALKEIARTYAAAGAAKKFVRKPSP
jgi:hypothetical protein